MNPMIVELLSVMRLTRNKIDNPNSTSFFHYDSMMPGSFASDWVGDVVTMIQTAPSK